MATRLADRRILGVEEPRVFTAPLRVLTPKTSRGFEVVEFAEHVLGVRLTPWQKWLYVHALELSPDGGYRYRTLVILIARQNGKTLWLQILALWGLYVDGIKLVLGTAQNLDVAEECWAGAVELAEGVPDLASEIAAVVQVNGKKQLKLNSGERYKVQAANRRGGRGLSGDLVALDELREHQTWDAWAAITKTTMAREDALVVGLSNAGDASSVVLSHLRALALDDIAQGRQSSLGLFEYSAPEGCDLDDRTAWAMANPSLGYTGLTEDAIEGARETDPEPVFRTEVLCQWVERVTPAAIPGPAWAKCLDDESDLPDGAPFAMAVDVSWDRSTAHVGVAGLNADGLLFVQQVAVLDPTEVVAWIASASARRWPLAIGVQGAGAPASSLIDDLSRIGIPLQALNGTDIGKACGSFYDLVISGQLRHGGQQDIEQAVAVAQSRPLGDAWALDRKRSPTDIAGLLAIVMAAHVFAAEQGREPQIIDPWEDE